MSIIASWSGEGAPVGTLGSSTVGVGDTAFTHRTGTLTVSDTGTRPTRIALPASGVGRCGWWQFPGYPLTALAARFYMNMGSSPSTTIGVIRFIGTGGAQGTVGITSSGNLLIRDNATNTLRFTGTKTLPLGEDVRIEAQLSAGVLSAQAYRGDTSTLLDSGSGTVGAGAVNEVWFGRADSAAATDWFIDDLALADTADPIGTAVEPPRAGTSTHRFDGTSWVALGATTIITGEPAPFEPPVTGEWSLIYESDLTTDDGWTARQETQSNDNSYNHPDNVSFGARGMIVEGRREERGGRPFTTGDVLGQHITVPNYFRADVLATLPTDYGMWPCPLWLRPLNSNAGEIDLCETWTYDWNGNPRSYSTIHDDYDNNRHESGMLPYSALPNPDPAAPHTYTCIKTPGRMEFLIDGVRVYCWQSGASWNGTQRIGPTPTWWDGIFEVPGRTWYPRVTLQLGGPNSADPVPEWQRSEVVIHRLRLYRETE